MTTYNTKIGEFCATHKCWELKLSDSPYGLKIKRQDGFVMFNYSQLESDFNNEIVREARGIIFREGEWEVPVCHAFDKFGNYGEEYVPKIDWDSIVVSEKIDGSIMKLWHYNGTWHVSTNGNIYAHDAPVDDIRKDNFQQVFWEGLVKHLPDDGSSDLVRIGSWLAELDTAHTYIFELVSPHNRVVIPYEETDVYFLGARNTISNREFGCDEKTAKRFHMEMFPRPKLYPLFTYDEIAQAASELPWNEEGYVCYDENFNRCKIKSPKYVIAHYSRNNNVITRKHLIETILRGEADEFLIYASDYKDNLMEVQSLMQSYVGAIDGIAVFSRGLRKLCRKDAAKIIGNFDKIARPIMFANYEGDVSGEDWVRNWDRYRWERVLDQYTKFKEK